MLEDVENVHGMSVSSSALLTKPCLTIMLLLTAKIMRDGVTFHEINV